MFEVVFILIVIDVGICVVCYLIQDFFGEVYKLLKKIDWILGFVFVSVFVCFMWGYLLYLGDIGFIWVLFGVFN